MELKNAKYKTLFKDTLVFALGNIGSKVIVFFLVPFYTYYLSPKEYGISDLVFTISQLAIPVFSLVIFDAVIRFSLYKKERPQDALYIGICVWIFGSIVTIVFTPLIGLYHAVSEWKWFISFYISLSILLSVEQNYLKATNRNLYYSIVSILQTLSLALLNILLVAHLKLGIKGYLISYIGSTAIASVLALVLGRFLYDLKRARFDKSLAIQMIMYSSPLILNNLSWWVIQSSDKFMLEEMVSSTALGIYTVASRIPSLITVFVTIFQQAWGISSIKEMDSSNDNGFYSNVFNVYSFIVFLGGIGICAFIKPFMDLYVRSAEYGDVWRYVPLLLASAVFSALAAYCGGMYGALKKSVNNMFTTVTAAIINLIVNYVSILHVGLWGAMIGTLVAYIVLAFIRIIDVKRYVDINIKCQKLIFNSCLILSQAVIVSGMDVSIGFLASAVVAVLFIVNNKREIVQVLHIIERGKN